MNEVPTFNLRDCLGHGDGTPDTPELIEQYLRCYIVERSADARPTSRGRRRRTLQLSPEGQEIVEIGRPYEGFCLVLDSETTTGLDQEPRFLIWKLFGLTEERRLQLHRRGRLDRDALDTLYEAGLVYNSERCTADEIETMRQWAYEKLYRIDDRDSFLEQFYRWVYDEQSLVIGHNLPFDLSRWARPDEVREGGGNGRRSFRGGFSLRLCRCTLPDGKTDCFDHPPLRMKHIGRYKTLIGFAHVRVPGAEGGDTRTLSYDGRFLDTAALGTALLGPGKASLQGLAERLKLPPETWKKTADYAGAVTVEYLDYCERDVDLTWAVYRELRDLYRRHGTGRPLWTIFSEASLGKAYLAELGVPRFNRRKPPVPAEIIGHSMQAYYGGRTETNIRLQPVEIELCDFKSQYPCLNAVMGLQSLILARSIEVRPCLDEVHQFLASRDLLDQLQRPDTWRRLRCLVCVRPGGDILPVRSRFGGAGVAAANIALCYLYGREPTWYTLADIVASVLLTGGKVPEIVEAIEFVPIGQAKTTPFPLFGDSRYMVDLTTDDLGARLIDLRSTVQAELKDAKSDADREYLDSLQRALKIVANAASYGVLLEVNARERTAKPQPVTVYQTEAVETRSPVVEEPGPYFAGAVGTFIPASGRLLLAIAERLASDRGLSYAFCDTDSMAFARPSSRNGDGMDRDAFSRHVADVRAWFTALSPFAGQPPIFEREKENDFAGAAEPLYCLAVSPKRYALYNRTSNGYRIRKVSAHGTGMWEPPAGYEPPSDIPSPVDETGAQVDPYRLGGPRWLYDLWYRAIEQAEAGETRLRVSVPGLDIPALHQVTVSTWQLWEQYRDIAGLKPFNFISVLPPLGGTFDILHLRDAWQYGEGVDPLGDWAARRDARQAAEGERRRVWRELLPTGMRPTAGNTLEDQPIPRSLYRRNGTPVDVVAQRFTYDDVGEFLGWLNGLYDRAKNAPAAPRLHEDNPYATLTPVTTFYAPYGRSFADIAGKVRRSDTHEPVDLTHRTMAECLSDYFQHPNYKAANPRHIGPAQRRHVVPAAHTFIGRETNRVLDEQEDESEGVLPYPDAEEYGRSAFDAWIQGERTGELAKALGISTRQVRNLKNGARPSPATRVKLDAYRCRRALDGGTRSAEDETAADSGTRQAAYPTAVASG